MGFVMCKDRADNKCLIVAEPLRRFVAMLRSAERSVDFKFLLVLKTFTFVGFQCRRSTERGTMAIAFLITAFVFSGSSAVAQNDEPTPEDHVYAGLTDFALLRDDVQKRFALFCIGENDIVDEAYGPRIRKIYQLVAGNAKAGFKYSASGHVLDPPFSGSSHSTQIWEECVRDDAKIKVRVGSPSSEGYVRRKGEKTNEFLERTFFGGIFDPFDDLIQHPACLYSPIPNDGWIEKTFLHQAKLVRATELVQGDVRSDWTWDIGDMHYDIEITHKKSLDYLPVETKYKCRPDARRRDFGHTKIEWKKNDTLKRELPHRIEMYYDTGGARTKHATMICKWLIGDQIGDEVFDFERSDNRLPFTKYFDFVFDVSPNHRYRPGTPWKAPEGLHPDSAESDGKRIAPK